MGFQELFILIGLVGIVGIIYKIIQKKIDRWDAK
jgi:hypothetical protein